MRTQCIILALLLAAVANTSRANFSGNDPLASGSNWNVYYQTPGSNRQLLFQNNRAEYILSSPATSGDNLDVHAWTASSGSYTQDWTIQVDVHLAALTLPSSGYADLSLVVVPSNNPPNPTAGTGNGFTVTIDRYNDGSQTVADFSAGSVFDGNQPSIQNTATDGSLRISFNSTQKTLTASFNAGNGWVAIGNPYSIITGSNNWSMGSSDVFIAALASNSGADSGAGATVNSGDAFYRNFKGSISSVGPHFFAAKIARYIQTTAAAPSLQPTTPYQVGSLLGADSPGSIQSATLTPPGGSSGGNLTLSDVNDGFGTFGTESKFSTQSSMNAAYPDGTYTIAGSGTSGSFSASLTLSGSFSTNVPTITNSGWAGGYLVIPPAAPTTLTWAALTDATANDGILLSVSNHTTGQGTVTTLLPATSVSYVLPALPPGTYDLQLLYLKGSGTSNSIPGATGYSGYANLAKITLTSLPVWPDATDLGGGWESSSWFGTFNVVYYPWIYHVNHGWMYVFGTDPTSIWLYNTSDNMGFLWTGSTVYPWLWSDTEQTWLYYVVGSQNPRVFYNWNAQKYETHNP